MESETTQIEEERKEVRLTNAKFASINEEFKKACEVVGVKNSTRQASKWRSKKGKAWNEGKK